MRWQGHAHTTAATSVYWGQASGDRLVVGSDDHSATVWAADVAPGTATAAQPVLRLVGHTGAVTCVVFDPGENLIATGSYDQSTPRHVSVGPSGCMPTCVPVGGPAVRLWSSTTGQLLAEYDGFTAPVTSCSFNLPAGDTLAAVARDGSVRLYKRGRRNPLPQLTATWLDHHRVRAFVCVFVCMRILERYM